MSLSDARAFGQRSRLLPWIRQERRHPAQENMLLSCVPAVRRQQMLLGGAGARLRDGL